MTKICINSDIIEVFTHFERKERPVVKVRV
jgi:hypothetical protein